MGNVCGKEQLGQVDGQQQKLGAAAEAVKSHVETPAGKAQAGAEIAQRQDSAKQQPVSKAEDVVIEEKSQDKEPGQADSLPPPAEMPAQGLPYTVGELGPPLPPCEEQRLATVRALNVPLDVEAPPDPEIESILKLVLSIFQCPAALVALFEDKRIFIREAQGGFQRGDFPWRWSFCGWTMASQQDQVMVIPDATKDARFAQNHMVTGPTGIRFYCGAPLIASNGHRLGTLCFADVKPRTFDAGQATILGNLAEMVVRHIEKDIALQLRTHDNAQLAEAYGNLKRAVDCFEHCVALLDLEQPGWKIMYVNAAWSKVTSTDREAARGRVVSETFELLGGGVVPSPAHIEAVRAGKEVVIEGVVVKGVFLAESKAAEESKGQVHNSKGSESTRLTSGTLGSSASRTPGGTKKLILRLRPAGKMPMDEGALLAAVPSYIARDDAPQHYYFLTVEEYKARQPVTPGGLTSGSEASWDTPIDPGLELGTLLGKGAFGKVYSGKWYGTPVAVKIIDQDMRSLQEMGVSMEALLGAGLRHPHVVQTLKYVVRKPAEMGDSTSSLQQSKTYFSDDTAKTSGHNSAVPAGAANVGCALNGAGSPAALASGTNAVSAENATATGTAENNTESTGAWAVMNIDSRMVHGLEEESSSSDSDGEGKAAMAPGTGAAAGSSSKAKRPGGVPAFGTGSTDSMGGMVPFLMQQPASGMTMTPGGTSSAFRGGMMSEAVIPTFAQTWIIMEYCDRGSLQDAVDRGWLKDGPAGGVRMEAIVATAHEVATALHYLHSHGIVHGDLSAWNVLLTSTGPGAAEGSRGFTAKIADFGLSRSLDVKTRIQTRTYGTITHQPPETLSDGVVSRETDTYSLGVLMWQMYCGSRPWAGMTHSQIIMTVASRARHLTFPPGVPAKYARIANSCLSYEIAARPSMAAVCSELAALKAELGMEGELS